MNIYSAFSHDVDNNGEMTIYIQHFTETWHSVASVLDCKRMSNKAKDELAQEILEERDFYPVEKFNFSNIEKGHTEEEYMNLFGYSYNKGELFDVSIEEIFDGSLEKNDDIVYWLIGEYVYETEIPYDHKTNLWR